MYFLDPLDPIKKNTFIYKNVQKYPKKRIFNHFYGFYGPKTSFYGSHKPQIRFIMSEWS